MDLVASDYARVAKLFYKLALAVRMAELSSHLANHIFFVLYFLFLKSYLNKHTECLVPFFILIVYCD